MSDHKGARLILEALPSGSTLIADRGYDSNWFREALADKNITSCIPPTKSVMTAALILSSQPSASRLPSPSTSINES